MCYVDPLLQYPGSLLCLELAAAKCGADHALGEGIELSNGSSDGGCQVLVLLFVPPRPDAAQAMVRHHFLEQLLWEEAGDKPQILAGTNAFSQASGPGIGAQPISGVLKDQDNPSGGQSDSTVKRCLPVTQLDPGLIPNIP